jgi:site-specific recombinase XerD
MNNAKYLSTWVKRFLTEYLISNRNLSINTLVSYRDTLRLIIPYTAKRKNKSIDKLQLENLCADMIKDFLLYIEKERKCSISTRNQRLAAIHAFAQFVGSNCIDFIEWSRMVKMIPMKRAPQKTITYLDRLEMDALLNEPIRQTKLGQRDYTLILLLYNTGARASEIAQMTISDFAISQQKMGISTVLINGKGNKQRRCPLWQQTVDQLTLLSRGRESSENLFINRQKQPITRFGIYSIIEKYAEKASLKIPSIADKDVSPHIIRHTTATHLLQSGVDINTIRAWLGHVSINTTNIYAEIDIEMKAKALSACEVVVSKKGKPWKENQDLMSFLDNLQA